MRKTFYGAVLFDPAAPNDPYMKAYPEESALNSMIQSMTKRGFKLVQTFEFHMKVPA